MMPRGPGLRFAYYAGLRAAAIPALVRRLRDAGVVLCYHNVLPPRNASDAGDRAVHLAYDRFAEQIHWIARRYAVVSLAEFVTRLRTGRSLRGAATVTFDDAYDGAFTHAWPLLSGLGLPATVFVVAEAPERQAPFWWDYPELAGRTGPTDRHRWLGDLKGSAEHIVSTLPLRSSPPLPTSHRPAPWSTIAAAAAAGLDVGVHSATHRTLTRLDDAELEREIVASREAIGAQIGATPEFFAYPYGLWDARVRDVVRAAGYRGAVTLDYGLVTARADPWALVRVNVPSGITLSAFEAWVAGLHPRRGRD